MSGDGDEIILKDLNKDSIAFLTALDLRTTVSNGLGPCLESTIQWIWFDGT